MKHHIRTLTWLISLSALILFSGNALAQGFDPSTVDWEKLSKIPHARWLH